MILEKAAALFLGGVALLSVASESVDWFESWGLSRPIATLATAAVVVSSATVLWRFGKAVCGTMRKTIKVVDHAASQPARDEKLRADLAALADEMRDRFERLEQFLDRRAKPRDT